MMITFIHNKNNNMIKIVDNRITTVVTKTFRLALALSLFTLTVSVVFSTLLNQV